MNVGGSVQLKPTAASVGVPLVFNVKDYGAKGDGRQLFDATITSGQATVTSATAAFTSGDVGKTAIFTAASGGGAVLVTTILSVTNSTTAVLAANAGSTIASGGIIAIGTSDYAAVNAALTAALAAGGGVVYFPAGVYLLTSTLVIPTISFSTAGSKQITLMGEYQPALSYTVLGTDITSQNGSILYSAINHINCGSTLTNVFVTIKNLLFRGIDNPTTNAIDLTNAGYADISDVTVDSGTPSNLQTFPGHSCVGISMPLNGNGVPNFCRNVFVTGYRCGFDATEHSIIDGLLIFHCLVGLQFEAAFHDYHITRACIVQCQYQVNFNGNNTPALNGGTSTVYGHLDFEHIETGTWAVTADIYDPGNVGVGVLYTHSVQSSVGVDSPIVSGGSKLSIRKLDTAKPAVTGSRGSNAALASLLTGLASLGLITDSSS